MEKGLFLNTNGKEEEWVQVGCFPICYKGNGKVGLVKSMNGGRLGIPYSMDSQVWKALGFPL